MKLMKYSIEIASENEDIVAASLYDCDVEGIEIEDTIPLTEDELKNMFVDIPKSMEDDGRAILSFYLDIEDEETQRILSNVKEELKLLKRQGLIEKDEIKVTDISSINWQDNWKKYFKPFNIENIYIVPTWEDDSEYAEKDGVIIRVDPGSAFGTGKHETTQLCIQEMRQYLKGNQSILDVGTGSGILGIIALKLGAKMINAIDIDSNVLGTVEENLINNQISKDNFNIKIGDITRDNQLMDFLSKQKHDIIIANILPDVLFCITEYIYQLMHEDSIYILSGILEIKLPEVEKFLKKYELEILSKRQMGEWVAITVKKKLKK